MHAGAGGRRESRGPDADALGIGFALEHDEKSGGAGLQIASIRVDP